MNSKHHPASQPKCIPAPAIGCTTFCESTPPDRHHVSTTVKHRGHIYGPKRIFQAILVVILCVYKQYVWCFCATIFRLLRLKSIKNRCFACKIPHVFYVFQTPSCLSTQVPLNPTAVQRKVFFIIKYKIDTMHTIYEYNFALLITQRYGSVQNRTNIRHGASTDRLSRAIYAGGLWNVPHAPPVHALGYTALRCLLYSGRRSRSISPQARLGPVGSTGR